MKGALASFYQFLDRPLLGWSRIVLALLVIPLVLAFATPLWKISLQAPQYPKGLSMEIYAHKIESGNQGRDLREINIINHYIGMRAIDRAELSELDWLPFAILALALLTLRCAAIGNVRTLIDLAVMSFFVGAYSMGRFVYKLHIFGTELDPTAPLKVDPFTPPVMGTRQIANFAAESWPQLGSFLITFFLVGIAAITVVHLVVGRLASTRDAALTPA
jgi:copper chaperone NosL